MTRELAIGTITVTALNDGVVHLPPTYYPGADFTRNPETISDEGTYDIPIGCFLIRGPSFVILVDAGLGPTRYPFPADVAEQARLTNPPPYIAEGGQLVDELARVGVRVDDVDLVLLTHLHADHIGWIAPHGRATFPRATVWCSAVDFHQPLVDPAPGEREGRDGLRRVFDAGLLRLLDSERHTLAPGVVAQTFGGHTVGHTVVHVSSGPDELYLIGDAVHHPDQLTDPGVSFSLERDPVSALRVRSDLFDRMAGQGIALGMAHWPGLEFQRITAGPDRRWTDA